MVWGSTLGGLEPLKSLGRCACSHGLQQVSALLSESVNREAVFQLWGLRKEGREQRWSLQAHRLR